MVGTRTNIPIVPYVLGHLDPDWLAPAFFEVYTILLLRLIRVFPSVKDIDGHLRITSVVQPYLLRLVVYVKRSVLASVLSSGPNFFVAMSSYFDILSRRRGALAYVAWLPVLSRTMDSWRLSPRKAAN